VRFFGEHTATLDAKSRVAVPAKLRDRVDERERDQFMLVVLPEGCLALYPMSEFERIDREIEARVNVSLAEVEQRDFERNLYSKAHHVQCDRQGRVLVPEKARQRAALGKDVTFVGARNRIELWDSARWEAQDQERTGSYAKGAKSVLGPRGA